MKIRFSKPKFIFPAIALYGLLSAALPGMFLPATAAADDARQLVDLPERMQTHMLANMREHMAAIHEILDNMGRGELDVAAEIAENRLGMSAHGSHGAGHMGRRMPKDMARLGRSMHKAASRFALRAQEGDPLPAYRALSEVTAACVACHAGYRIR